jgi:NitT/TauT family transport system substrate-binding protein
VKIFCANAIRKEVREMIKHITSRILGLMVICLYLMLVSCQERSDLPGERKVVTAAAINAYSGPFYIASEKGFWKEEGLKVTEKYFTSGRLCLDALLAGGADIVTVAETPIVFAGFSGQNVVIVATMSSATNDLKVIARRDQGITKPEDLRGKKVAMLFGATSEYYAGLFLAAYGMSFDDVNRLNLNPSDMPFALIKGDIDAYVIWEPFVHNAYKELGEEIPIIAKRAGMGVEVLRAIWGDYEFNVGLDPSLLEALQREAQWAKAAGLAPTDSAIPDYRAFIDSRALRMVDSAKVKIE